MTHFYKITLVSVLSTFMIFSSACSHRTLRPETKVVYKYIEVPKEQESYSEEYKDEDSSAVAESPIIKIAQKKKAERDFFPIEYNKQVEKWITYFSKKDRERFSRFLKRGSELKSYIQSVLKDNGLPVELYYLAMIESGFVLHARSHASAVGAWQFMKGTAKDYGLRVNYYVDERRDLLRSTEAAADYLRDLYNTLGSWPLAIAAYNSGESRVRNAVRRSGTRNFWKLSQKRALPRETRNYVPKFMAAAIIGENLAKFGFSDYESKETQDVAKVKVPGAVRLNSVSQVSSIPVKTLKSLNPHILRGVTPRGSYYEVWVPKADARNLESQFTVLKKKRNRLVAGYRESGGKHRSVHRVRRGQTLSGIAKRYGVSISYLRRINNLSGSHIYVNQKLKVSAPSVARRETYTVRRGDTLSSIARRYGRSTSSLKRLNNLRSSRIMVGQKLKLKYHEYSGRRTIHRVAKGENLTSIAKKYMVSLRDLKRHNRLNRSRIYPGQNLKIPGDNKRVKYKVKRGDNLISIARKFGVTLRRLKQINGLKNSKINAGQWLIVMR